MDYLHPEPHAPTALNVTVAATRKRQVRRSARPPEREIEKLMDAASGNLSGRIERGLAAPSITRIALRKLRELRKPLGQGSAQTMRKAPRGRGKNLGPIPAPTTQPPRADFREGRGRVARRKDGGRGVGEQFGFHLKSLGAGGNPAGRAGLHHRLAAGLSSGGRPKMFETRTFSSISPQSDLTPAPFGLTWGTGARSNMSSILFCLIAFTKASTISSAMPILRTAA